MKKCHCKPVPPPPRPVVPAPPAEPCPCPPRVYRNPPDVLVSEGDHIKVETRETMGLTDYVVSAVPFAVKVDSETMYGDGVNTPIGTYEFEGKEPGLVPEGNNDATRFLRGDGKWAKVVIPKQEQADWDELDRSKSSFIRNKPDIDGMIDSAVNAEATRAMAAEAAAKTEVIAGENITVNEETAADGHIIYIVNGVGNTRECTAAEMDAWIDEVEQYG